MADYDDAVSPVGDDDAPSRRSYARTGGNPFARGWAWFSAQPMQTKVVVIGVVVVLGVVAWMALRKKTPADTSSEDVSPGAFGPLGASSRMGNNPGLPTPTVPPTALPPTSVPTSVSTSVPQSSGIVAPVTTGASPLQVTAPTGDQPAAFRPPATWPVTPEGSSKPPTMKRTDVPLSGTITPVISRVGAPKRPPTYVAPAAGAHTERGQDVSF